MGYAWENDARENYGNEAVDRLVTEQEDYETKNKGNDCAYCGENNSGTLVTGGKNEVDLIHVGLWTDGVCDFCGKPQKRG